MGQQGNLHIEHIARQLLAASELASDAAPPIDIVVIMPPAQDALCDQLAVDRPGRRLPIHRPLLHEPGSVILVFGHLGEQGPFVLLVQEGQHNLKGSSAHWG